MHYILIIVAVLWLLYMAIEAAIVNWQVTLPITLLVLCGYAFYLKIKKDDEEIARHKAEREAERQKEEEIERKKRAAREAHEIEQRRLSVLLSRCVASTEDGVRGIQKEMVLAQAALEHAEQEFAEGVFAPFWDAVEQAANHLARSDSGINQIIRDTRAYRDAITTYEAEPPAFRIGLDTLPDTTRTADRMRAIVRQAQKHRDFAIIYEQRKTNKLLIAGFTNLAEAMNGMSDRLCSSIDALADSLSAISETDRANSAELIASVQKLHESMESDSSARREHEGKQREMLDNIQRGRKPRTVYPKTFD